MEKGAGSHLQYLDPVVLSSIGSLDLVARMVVEGFISGLHESPFRGFNVEFTEHRPYSPGDEIRHIDWRAFAKVDRFLVKEFEEETNLRAWVLLDSSRSMEYQGKNRLSKIDYARVLAASLSYLILKQRDGAGLITFDDQIVEFIPPRTKPSHLEAITDGLAHMEFGPDTQLENVLGAVAERVRRRGVIILISDLIDDPESTLKGLRHLRHLRHDLILFHILDDDEVQLPFRGVVRFKDPESGREILTDPGRLHEEYQKQIEDFQAKYRNGATEVGADYIFLKTSDPLDRALAHFLANRKKFQSGRRLNVR
jgi:uncharacterized protein (DUF58 family)